MPMHRAMSSKRTGSSTVIDTSSNTPAPDRDPVETMGEAGRLLVLSATAEIGGTERVILTLAQALTRRRITVDVVFPEGEGTSELLAWFQSAGIGAHASSAVRSIYQSHSLSEMLAFRRLIRRSRATTVNLHYGGNHISLKDVIFTR